MAKNFYESAFPAASARVGKPNTHRNTDFNRGNRGGHGDRGGFGDRRDGGKDLGRRNTYNKKDSEMQRGPQR